MMMMQITFLGELSVKKNILNRQRTGKIQDDKTRQTDTTSVSSVSLHHSYMSKYPFTRTSQTMTYIMHQNKNSVHLYYVYQG